MSTNRNLLKEAIADAKTVKETAIANAKAVLEESFAPQLKSMISLKLQEMADEDEKEDLEEVGFGKSRAEGDEGFSDMREKALDEEMEEEMDENLDLEELLQELNEAEEEESDEDEKESEEEEEESEEEGEPIDLEDFTDEDLKDMIEDVIKDMMKSGELEMDSEEGAEEIEGGEEEVEDEEINLEELLKEIEALDEEDMEEEGMMYEEDEDMMYENTVNSTVVEDLKKELEEAYSTIETLRGDLNEVNLLNAKLLYTNKIFKSKNLTENQKVKVLSSFDKATTVGEVKLVFETLNEGLKVKTTKLNENLGSASKVLSAPKKQPIVESNDMVARFQKLAGII